MTAYIIPLLFLTVLLLSAVRRKSAYAAFVEGSRSALDLIASVFPYLITVMMAVEVFRQSGCSAYLARAVAPCMRTLGIPPELTELMLVRPLSGAGALGILEGIFTTYGADSYIGKCAAIIYGSSETIFYISAIYFSRSDVKRLGYAIPVALFSTFVGCVLGCAVLRAL